MKRVALGLATLAMLAAFAACSEDDKNKAPKCDGEDECVVPWDCAVGYTCDKEAGCCVEFGCEPGTCPVGTFCDGDTKECTSVADACVLAPNGCECHIVNFAGDFEATSDPSIPLPAGATFEVEAILSIVGGGPLPGATFSFGVDNDLLFDVDGSKLTAKAAAAGTATLTAEESGHQATCTADLVHLGETPAGDVRFFVFDDRTGSPKADAQIIMDAQPTDGTADTTLTTAADGTITTAAPAGKYDVTVFLAGYNYLSIVGIPATTSEVALPVAARPAEPMTAGFTGRASFDDYERLVLGGVPKTIEFGIVSTSFSLASLLNLDLDLLIGPIANPEGGCNQTDGSGNHPAGCYHISLPNLFDEWAPLPGGVLLSLTSTPIKSSFDVVGQPGRRYAWGLGGELNLEDISDLATSVLDILKDCGCDDNVETGTCPAECACDADCPVSLDFGQLFNGLMPLFSAFASGVRGNLALQGLAQDDWEDYISVEYAERLPDDRFEKLDGNSKLAIREPLEVFTDFAIGDLPVDPGASVVGQQMEGVILLSGVNTTGFGFVPLGLGLGVDCTTDRCLDRGGTGANDFDGKINGGRMCIYSTDPTENTCGPGVPTSELGDGHLGLFHAKAHGGLQGQDWLTIAVALPVSAFMESSSDIRVAAKISRSEPTAGASNQLAGNYPTFPAAEGTQVQNQLTVNHTDGTDVHWVKVFGGGADWDIYFPDDGGTFHRPAPTGADPFNDTAVNLTHIGFATNGKAELADLAANNGTTLAELLNLVEGFTVTSGDVPVVDP
ncbi:MAG: hypothetical protein A2289_18335 [Deltaproteobacteria bacterium RIFOXYA12_FULL_58_15]|nr:MAG: hypothetical protein A2289_18335 [Deltaproteobacteria bacterium RIFOXYA12_FULL_58_15]OGR15096.1 MAG: hypothetical protein A2341_03815 [Deltaproteobacteria bacterium RIFOXYB12_FULL_58_9]